MSAEPIRVNQRPRPSYLDQTDLKPTVAEQLARDLASVAFSSVWSRLVLAGRVGFFFGRDWNHARAAWEEAGRPVEDLERRILAWIGRG